MLKKTILIANDYIDETTKQIIINTSMKCSVFKFEGNELYQDNKKIFFKFEKVLFNEDLYQNLVKLIHWIHSEIVPQIKTSNKYESQEYGVKHEGKIESVIYSIIIKFMNLEDNNEKKDLFDFVSILLFRITKAHAFHNGNKRTAILFVSYLLNSFGFYILWSSYNDDKNNKYIKEWEGFMIEISKQENNKENEIIYNIKNKIVQSTWINLRSK